MQLLIGMKRSEREAEWRHLIFHLSINGDNEILEFIAKALREEKNMIIKFSYLIDSIFFIIKPRWMMKFGLHSISGQNEIVKQKLTFFILLIFRSTHSSFSFLFCCCCSNSRPIAMAVNEQSSVSQEVIYRKSIFFLTLFVCWCWLPFFIYILMQ